MLSRLPPGAKHALKNLLLKPWLARPLRKFLSLEIRILSKVVVLSQMILGKLPWVQQLDRRSKALSRAGAILRYYSLLMNQVALLGVRPRISVLVPLYKVKPSYFRETLESVAFQVYDNWELCVVDDRSGMPELEAIVRAFEARFPGKVKFARNEVNSHISVTSNACLELATGEYVALLDHDDRLFPNALGEMVRHINLHREPDVLYSDECVVDGDGESLGFPFFKPSYSPFLHLCVNYTTHLSVYRTELLRRIGGFRKGYEGSQDHDVALRAIAASRREIVHVPFCLYQWRAHPESTAAGIGAKPYAVVAGEKAVAEALAAAGRPALVEWSPKTHHYRLRFELPSCLPLVSLVIPSKDAFEHVNPCLSSIISKSTYPNLEVVLVDNGTTDARCLDLFERMKAERGDRFSLLVDRGSFNFARLVNAGVEAAKGEFVVLLNNDTEVLTPDWLEEMYSYARFPEIGAVGCKLLYPSGKMQHAGVVMLDRRIAGHAGVGMPRDCNMYCQMTQTVHEVAAVTAACLMIEKRKYTEVGGLDELWVPNGFGDVDLCLALRAKGYTNIYTGHAELTHFESPSRGVTIEAFEKFFLMKKWPDALMNDPYLNPNLARGCTYTPTEEALHFVLSKEEFAYFLSHPRAEWTPAALEAAFARR